MIRDINSKTINNQLIYQSPNQGDSKEMPFSKSMVKRTLDLFYMSLAPLANIAPYASIASFASIAPFAT